MVTAKIYAFFMSGWDSPKDCKEMQPSTFGIFIFKIRGVLGGERERVGDTKQEAQLQFHPTDKKKHKK